ncbi:cupin domain-containing protein [Kribbella sp. NBC_00359]|uniref:cupin domain-containing protein n=1 Tax=Kribbella sp. NBC_00359 TaxID=2975966 RepID=UPI002E1A76CC
MPTAEVRVLNDSSFEAHEVGVPHQAGITSESVGATNIAMQVVTIAPGGRSLAHHHGYEEALYVVGGEAETWWGEQLEHCTPVRPGDLLYIPSGCPHLAVNRNTVPVVAVVARADPFTHGGVFLMPELDGLVR